MYASTVCTLQAVANKRHAKRRAGQHDSVPAEPFYPEAASPGTSLTTLPAPSQAIVASSIDSSNPDAAALLADDKFVAMTKVLGTVGVTLTEAQVAKIVAARASTPPLTPV